MEVVAEEADWAVEASSRHGASTAKESKDMARVNMQLTHGRGGAQARKRTSEGGGDGGGSGVGGLGLGGGLGGGDGDGGGGFGGGGERVGGCGGGDGFGGGGGLGGAGLGGVGLGGAGLGGGLGGVSTHSTCVPFTNTADEQLRTPVTESLYTGSITPPTSSYLT